MGPCAGVVTRVITTRQMRLQQIVTIVLYSELFQGIMPIILMLICCEILLKNTIFAAA